MSALARLCDGGTWSRGLMVWVVVAGQVVILSAGLAVCAWAGVL
jgi:hypothetical protein